MKNTEWPRDKIRDVAGSSGKPLEVVCAEAFLGAGWKPRLGSHFADGALGTIRELDVLVEKEENLPGRSLTVRVRALLSCRDFPPERSPLTYSVSTARVPSFEPRLLSSHRATERLLVSGRSFGPLLEAEAGGAARLLRATNLDAARPLVAFDMFERTEQASKKGKNKKATVGFQRCRDGDRRLFSAIDSAVKAAFFWVQEDLQLQRPVHFATLNVPVCLLAVPFWDVCIDGGEIGQPEIKHRGFQSNLYPYSPGSKEVMTLVWTTDDISDLINALDDLYVWFRGEIEGV
jgi:hypothetical protein